MPRVSVIIPAHDSAAFLPAALRSVETQTYADWEVVAVDDGSRDETWSILDSAGPQVRALQNQTAAGPAAARNRALKKANGEFVVFLDADDLLLPRYLERQLACFEAATGRGRRVGLVTCDALILDGEAYAPHTYLDTIRDHERPLTLDRVLRRNPIFISSLVPAAVGGSVGWFDTELFGTEDFGLWLKILEQGFEAILNPEPLAVYRRRVGTVSTDIARQGANNRRAYELALQRGALSARQQRLARRAIRYNRAMETVATLRFGADREHSLAALLRALPLLLWVAATNPRWWTQWLTILRSGRRSPITRRNTKAVKQP
jgi:glycosyltransferase involved in cell wall biosynthesis